MNQQEPSQDPILATRRRTARGLAMTGYLSLCLAVTPFLIYDAFTGGFASMYAFGFDTLGLAAYASVVMACIPLWYCSWRTRLVALGGLAVAYVGSYAVLSATGDYYMTRSGRTR
jgi:hypothetical protein